MTEEILGVHEDVAAEDRPKKYFIQLYDHPSKKRTEQLKQQILSALKLQELIKEYLKIQSKNMDEGIYRGKDHEYYNMFLGKLYSFMKESENAKG